MGRLDQSNKAQTPVGYSHGTEVSTGNVATAVTLMLLRGVKWIGTCPHASATGVGHGLRERLDRSGCPWSHSCMNGHMGYAKVLQLDDELRLEKDMGVNV